MPQERSCGAVVFKDDDYLVLLYGAGHWDFVKGNVEPGELAEETAKREAREEAGIDIKILPGFREKIEYFYKREGKTIHKEVVFFLAEASTKDVKLSFEHKEFKWLPFDRALRQLTHDNAKEVLRKAHEHRFGKQQRLA
jgi:8-oxo-dGTP pyrophosphatase MutT (NUDIX family)